MSTFIAVERTDEVRAMEAYSGLIVRISQLMLSSPNFRKHATRPSGKKSNG